MVAMFESPEWKRYMHTARKAADPHKHRHSESVCEVPTVAVNGCVTLNAIPFCVAHPLEDRLQQSSEALSYLQKAAHQWPRGQSVIGMIPMLDSHDPNHDPLIALPDDPLMTL